MMKLPLKGLEILDPPDSMLVSKTTDAMIKQAIRSLAFQLPVSYQKWCKVYGAGELAGFFRIAAPMKASHSFNLIDYNNALKEGEQEEMWRERIGDSLFDNSVFFAETIGGEFYCWNKSAKPSGDEFPIYYIPRDGSPSQCAVSFSDWILITCLLPAENEEGRSRWYFRRFFQQ